MQLLTVVGSTSLFLLLFASGVACSVETKTIASPTPEPTSSSGETETTADAAPPNEVVKEPVKDASPDVVVKKPEWTAGESGKSCADACKTKGKTCAVACTEHRSCGGHDDKAPPYAGYACYYRETKNNGGSFRSNEGRSLMTCAEIATYKWDSWGSEYTIGDYLGGNPVSCCCE